MHFQFSIRRHDDRLQAGSFFEDPNFSEATRLIELKLHLISPDAVPKYYTLDRFPPREDTKYPTLYFSGSSHGIQGREATVVGSVHMAENGVVRWRFVGLLVCFTSYMKSIDVGETSDVCERRTYAVEVILVFSPQTLGRLTESRLSTAQKGYKLEA